MTFIFSAFDLTVTLVVFFLGGLLAAHWRELF
jgi:hypothetical protein